MKKILLLTIRLFLFFPLIAREIPEDVLRNLDKALLIKEEFTIPVQQKINRQLDQLRLTHDIGRRYAIYSRLFEDSQSYSCDSALNYARQTLSIANALGNPRQKAESVLRLSEIYSTMGFYMEALQSLEQIKPDSLDSALYPQYLNTAIRVYGILAAYNSRNPQGKVYQTLADNYRDSLLAVSPPSGLNFALVSAELAMLEGNPQKAVALLTDRYNQPDPFDRNTAFIAYTLAEAYAMEGDVENEIRYYAISALSDIHCGVKENLSLRKLAVLLYEQGDIDRAYRYIKESMEDSIFSGARMRTLEISEVLPVIVKAYQDRQDRQRVQLLIFTLLISILTIGLVVVLLVVFRQMKTLAQARGELRKANIRLEEMNRKLSEANERQHALNCYLSESNEVKEGYIGHFLNLCSVYIEKLESYKKLVNRKIIAGQIDELQKMTASDKLVESELREFHTNFDNTFLLLYPTFVEELNALLREEERFPLRKGEGLNTELRIFALIRLGITDSARIAGFLRYSAQTIYNYRTKVRNKATDRDDFEERVKGIGRTNL